MAFSWGSPISLRGDRGEDGKQGVGFGTTSGKPTDQGQPNESRLDPEAFTIWTWQGTDWTTKGSFAGQAGIAGPVDFFTVSDTPPTSDTYNGDGAGLAIVGLGSEVWIYSKANGWSDSGQSLKGRQGDQGIPGRRGSVRFVGNGPPPDDVSTLTIGDVHGALPGDVYRDQSTSGGPYEYVLNQ